MCARTCDISNHHTPDELRSCTRCYMLHANVERVSASAKTTLAVRNSPSPLGSMANMMFSGSPTREAAT